MDEGRRKRKRPLDSLSLPPSKRRRLSADPATSSWDTVPTSNPSPPSDSSSLLDPSILYRLSNSLNDSYALFGELLSSFPSRKESTPDQRQAYRRCAKGQRSAIQLWQGFQDEFDEAEELVGENHAREEEDEGGYDYRDFDEESEDSERYSADNLVHDYKASGFSRGSFVIVDCGGPRPTTISVDARLTTCQITTVAGIKYDPDTSLISQFFQSNISKRSIGAAIDELRQFIGECDVFAKGSYLETRFLNGIGLWGDVADWGSIDKISLEYQVADLAEFGVRKFPRSKHDSRKEVRFFLEEFRRILE